MHHADLVWIWCLVDHFLVKMLQLVCFVFCFCIVRLMSNRKWLLAISNRKQLAASLECCFLQQRAFCQQRLIKLFLPYCRMPSCTRACPLWVLPLTPLHQANRLEWCRRAERHLLQSTFCLGLPGRRSTPAVSRWKANTLYLWVNFKIRDGKTLFCCL